MSSRMSPSGVYAAAVLPAVDLDQDGWRGRLRRDQAGHFEVVGDHDNVCALGIQPDDLLQLLRRDADGIEDVGDAVAEEILRLGRVETVMPPVGRRSRGGRPSIHLAVFMCGRSGTDRPVQRCRHDADVAVEDGAVQHQARRRQVGKFHTGNVQLAVSSIGSTGRGMYCHGKRDRIGLVSPGASTSMTCSWRKKLVEPAAEMAARFHHHNAGGGACRGRTPRRTSGRRIGSDGSGR